LKQGTWKENALLAGAIYEENLGAWKGSKRRRSEDPEPTEGDGDGEGRAREFGAGRKVK
jgi:hypothetical protein